MMLSDAMKIKIIEKNESEIKFSVDDITPAFANSLRRVMMNEVPTMAIEWVDFKKNDSVLPDEVLANRLAQIPLTFDRKAYDLPTECKCEGKGCSRCQIELVLKKKGPCMVYSGDLKSKSKDVNPVFDDIPIVELLKARSCNSRQWLSLALVKTISSGRLQLQATITTAGHLHLMLNLFPA